MLLYLDNHLSVGPHSSAALRAELRDAPAQDRHQRESRSRDPRAPHARRRQRLHAGRRHHVRGSHHRLVDRRWAGTLRGRRARANSFSPRAARAGREADARQALPRQRLRPGRRGAERSGRAPRHRAAHRGEARAPFHRGRAARRRPSSRLAQAFGESAGDLPAVYRALINAREAWAAAARQVQDAHRLRRLELPRTRRCRLIRTTARSRRSSSSGQRNWQPGSPAGWPDRSADWDGASALLKRLEWADVVGQRLGSRRDAHAARTAAARREPHRGHRARPSLAPRALRRR